MHFQGSITRKPYNVRGPNFVHIIIRVVNVLTKFHGNLRGRLEGLHIIITVRGGQLPKVLILHDHEEPRLGSLQILPSSMRVSPGDNFFGGNLHVNLV